ncbi:MAG: glycerate kinase [Aeromonadaceae bacterium]
MKIVIAPDSFKESLSASEVAEAIEAGFKQVLPDACYVKLPMADGGEGSVRALVEATAGRIVPVTVTGPLGHPVAGFFGLLGDGQTAVIEMAAASGLQWVAPELRNPLMTTSYGMGELIVAALDLGVHELILGIGGSATNDGGAGMIQALGGRLLKADGRELGRGGGALGELARLDLCRLDPRLAKVKILVACDVDNPLCGPKGASAIFGPQKGATPAMVATLDMALAHYGHAIETLTGRAVLDSPGAGAGGGIGAALVGLLGAELKPGVDIVMTALDLASAVADADLVVTGEGRLDGQTLHGKTPIGVARCAKRFGKPVIAIVGSLGEGCEGVYTQGIDAMFAILPRAMPLPEALASAHDNLRLTARNVAALWQLMR